MEVEGRQARRKSSSKRTTEKHQVEAQQTVRYWPQHNAMHEKEDVSHPLFNPYAISLVPDPLNELPTWYHREVESATASASQFRVNYPLHNPTGPRWYFNHHLLPPDHDGRPPSVFSPSFPPMVSAPERGQDPSRMAGPSRTPSRSPLPTPTSSQIRIQEPTKPRARKMSQNTHDNVEISGKTDTWSPNGSHQPSHDHKVDSDSPNIPTNCSNSPTNHLSHRPRRASMTHGSRHRTMAPSPLSQSTSAVHLQAIDSAQIQLPRKLSKRRKPFTGLFGNDDSIHTRNLRRSSTVAPSMTSLPSFQSAVKPKRGNVLGRLVKRFSVLRKTEKPAALVGHGSNWYHVNSVEQSPMHTPTSPHPSEPHERISPHPPKSPSARRIPPPSIEVAHRDSLATDRVDQPNSIVAEGRRSSESSSVHEILTSGRLTIANPDDTSSDDNASPYAMTPTPTTHLPGERTSMSSGDDLPLPDIPRTDSPDPMNSASSSRPHSLRLAEPINPPPAPSSPPLPELPPPTPTPPVRTLAGGSQEPPAPSPFTPSFPSAHTRNAGSSVASPASTVIPLPPPEDIARASMYVNPPTPYAAPAPPLPETSKSQCDERSVQKSKEPSRSKSVRQTETFKLVRSPSTNMNSAEVITGMGEHWEVVGAPAESKKTREKEREKSRSSGRNQGVHREESNRRREQSSSADEGDAKQRRQPSTSGRDKAPSITSVRSTQTPVSRRSVRKVSDAADSRASKASSANIPASSLHERHLSGTASTRPNSELHSAAELSVRAKDAWDMHRLWKARSMAYGSDGMPVVSAPATIGSDSRPSTLMRVSSIPSVATVAEMQKVSTHGSSHTYVVVQNYQDSDSYSQFASTPDLAQQFYRHPGAPDPSAHNPLPSPPRLSAYQTLLPSVVTNPLPDPPRLSAYKPAPLPPSLTNAGDSSPTSRRRP